MCSSEKKAVYKDISLIEVAYSCSFILLVCRQATRYKTISKLTPKQRYRDNKTINMLKRPVLTKQVFVICCNLV